MISISFEIEAEDRLPDWVSDDFFIDVKDISSDLTSGCWSRVEKEDERKSMSGETTIRLEESFDKEMLDK